MQEYPRGGFANGEVLNEGLEHLPCVILLDTSGSMAGCIDELNDALAMFKADLESDVNARAKVEACLIAFDDSAHIVAPFSAVRNLATPVLSAGGLTALHEAIDVAIEEIDARRKQYKSLGTISYKPFIFLMTDGYPSDDYKAGLAALQTCICTSMPGHETGLTISLFDMPRFRGRGSQRV